MNLSRSLLACFLVAGWILPASVRAADLGGQQSPFELGLSARSIALGNALAAVPDDAGTALSGNPAALTTLSRGHLSLFYTPLFEGVHYDAIGLAVPSMERGTVGFSGAMVTVPDIDARDAGNFSTGTFDYAEQQISLAYALRVTEDLSLGVQGFNTRMKMGTSKASSSSAHFGAYLRRAIHPRLDWMTGVSFKDWVQTGFELGEERDRNAPSIVGGFGLNRRTDRLSLLLLLQPSWIRDNGMRIQAGAEALWKKTLALRGGWNGDQWSTGAGLAYQSLSVDYALSFQQSFGSTHRVSLSWRFGRDVIAAAKDRKTREDRLKAEILEKLKRDSIRNYLSAGKRHLSAGNYDEARQEFSKILAWDPRDAEALARIEETRIVEIRQKLKAGDRLTEKGDYLDAMVQYKSVLDLDPKNRSALQGMKTAEERVRAESRRAFESVKTLPADQARRYFDEGLTLYLNGQYTQALERWKIIISGNPINRQIFDYVSRAQVKLEEDKARVERSKQIEVRQSRVQILRKQALQSYGRGDLKGAIEAWKELIKVDPRDEEARIQLEKSEKELLDSRKRGVRW